MFLVSDNSGGGKWCTSNQTCSKNKQANKQTNKKNATAETGVSSSQTMTLFCSFLQNEPSQNHYRQASTASWSHHLICTSTGTEQTPPLSAHFLQHLKWIFYHFIIHPIIQPMFESQCTTWNPLLASLTCNFPWLICLHFSCSINGNKQSYNANLRIFRFLLDNGTHQRKVCGLRALCRRLRKENSHQEQRNWLNL